MKILHVITSLRTGGAEKLMVDLLPRLRDMGNEVELLVFDGIRTPFTAQLEEQRIMIHSLREGGSVYDVRNIFALKPYLQRFDIVHTHNTACQMYVAAAKKLFGMRDLHIVTTEHSTSNRRRNHRWMLRLDRWMYRQYERIITVSDIAGQNIKEYVGDHSLPIVTVPNGIDTARFINAASDQDILHKWGHVHRAVMVAGFRYEKDQETVIKAFALLPQDYHIFFVGDGVERPRHEQLAASLNIADKVHFLGMRSDVPNVLKAANVVIMSSHREGLSLSNLEGMACGRPFIASDVEGLHEIVDGYGVLFPHQDAKALADAITYVTTDSDYAESVSATCVERAKQFDIRVMAERYNHIYQELD